MTIEQCEKEQVCLDEWLKYWAMGGRWCALKELLTVVQKLGPSDLVATEEVIGDQMSGEIKSAEVRKAMYAAMLRGVAEVKEEIELMLWSQVKIVTAEMDIWPRKLSVN